MPPFVLTPSIMDQIAAMVATVVNLTALVIIWYRVFDFLSSCWRRLRTNDPKTVDL